MLYRDIEWVFIFLSGFPGYGYLPAAPTPSAAGTERISAQAAYDFYAAAAAAGAPAHMAGHGLAAGIAARSEPSPMAISSSPLHRDQFSQRAAAGTSCRH